MSSNRRLIQTFVPGRTVLRGVQMWLREGDADLGDHRFELRNRTSDFLVDSWTIEIPGDDAYHLICFPLSDTSVSAWDFHEMKLIPNSQSTSSNHLGIAVFDSNVYGGGELEFFNGTDWIDPVDVYGVHDATFALF